MRLAKRSLQFALNEDPAQVELLEAYGRLIDDAMVADRSLFANTQGIGRRWEGSDELIDDPPEVHRDPQETWGPEAIGALIAPRTWRRPFQRTWRGPREPHADRGRRSRAVSALRSRACGGA